MSTPTPFLLFLKVSIVCFLLFLLTTSISATQAIAQGGEERSFSTADPSNIVINEIAWMGTNNSANDEWVELYNNTDNFINLDDWQLIAQDGTPKITLSGIIPANGFYLLERTNDDTVPGISADKIYTGALGNSGENLKLYDNLNNIVDEVNYSEKWFAGDNKTKQTMEKTSTGWQTSQNAGGTPKAKNSIIVQAEPQLKSESEKPAVEEAAPSKELQESQTQKQLAAVGPQIPEPSKSLYIFLTALGLAISSGVFVLFLKKKQKNIGSR
jgi:hypothetical protein